MSKAAVATDAAENITRSAEEDQNFPGYNPFAMIISSAVDDVSLSDANYRILGLLCTYASPKNSHMCWPSQATLAKRMNLSVRAIRKAATVLATLGYVSITPAFFENKKRISNTYQINRAFELPDERNREKIAASRKRANVGGKPTHRGGSGTPSSGGVAELPVPGVAELPVPGVAELPVPGVAELPVPMNKKKLNNKREEDLSQQDQGGDPYFEVQGAFGQAAAYLQAIGLLTTKQREKLLRLSRLERHDSDRADYRLVCIDAAALQFATKLQADLCEALRVVPGVVPSAQVAIMSGLPQAQAVAQ